VTPAPEERFEAGAARQNALVTDAGAARVAERAGTGRARVLDALRREPAGLGVQELATRTGLHANTVRFHIEHLADEGLVARRVEPRTTPGRPRLTFTAVSRPDLGRDRRNYRMLAEMLAGFMSNALPDPAAQAAALGRDWGSYLAHRPAPYRRSTEDEARTELLRVLDDIGFEPELQDESGEGERAEQDDGDGETAPGEVIRLRHCPFLEVAESHPDVACSIHLGLMQGVLGELRAPLAAEGLRPFAEPSACIARLRPTSVAPGPGATDRPQPPSPRGG
jgi:predicted ArsR family transcriptional regulator